MDYGILFNFQQYFRYVMAVSFFGFFFIEETEVHRINYSQTLLHKVVSSTP